MDDHASPNPLLRRKSIAGPYMRSSLGIPAEHRPTGATATTSSASTDTTTPPAPLTRANTDTGGWFGGWFSSRRSSISSSASVIPRPPEDTVEDAYAQLASSAPQVLPPKADSRDALLSSTGGPRPAAPAAGQSPAAASGEAPPPLARRLSEVALKRPANKAGPAAAAGAGAGANSGTAAAIASSPPAGRPSLLETDIRQGPIETDLFWLVLRDIGE